MNELKEILTYFNQGFTLFFVFPSIILLGLYLTIRLKAIQVTKLGHSVKHLLSSSKESEGNISHFEAISAVLAGNFGTGNISGIAVALSTGGPGALVWMWVMAFFGSAIQYASCLLGMKYRTTNSKGEYVGGPMYYLSNGMGKKKLGILFSLLTIFGAVAVGDFAQVNSMSLPLVNAGLPPFFAGLLMAAFVAFVTLGGMQRMARLAALIVPLKAFVYLGTASVLLAFYYDRIPAAFALMFHAAFDLEALMGGVLGAGVLKALTTGFDRGIFATDAGTGIVPILQAGARSSNPVIDGLVTLITPLLVMIVCTMTGLVLIVTGAWQQADLQSTNMVTYAFSHGLGSEWGSFIVAISLILFGYTTVLAWACCAEQAVGYIWGAKYAQWAKYIYLCLIPFGAMVQVDLAWTLADIAITLMLFTNLIGVASLSREVIKDTEAYFLPEKAPLQEAVN